MSSKDKCPYSTSVNPITQEQELIRKDYDFQYNENHELEVVLVGETDLIKEVASHANEVGLVNVIKNAIAHGENPYLAFKKSEPGMMAAIDPNATVDEVMQAQKDVFDKLDKIASELGVSRLELITAMNDGTINNVIAASQKKKEEIKDGE